MYLRLPRWSWLPFLLLMTNHNAACTPIRAEAFSCHSSICVHIFSESGRHVGWLVGCRCGKKERRRGRDTLVRAFFVVPSVYHAFPSSPGYLSQGEAKLCDFLKAIAQKSTQLIPSLILKPRDESKGAFSADETALVFVYDVAWLWHKVNSSNTLCTG